MAGQNTPRIAITVQKYHHPGQTFVNRHIKHLFGGNSCVIAERRYRDVADEPSHMFMSDVIFNARDIIAAPYNLTKNHFTHHAFRVPYGNNRKALIAYLRKQKVDAILSEFGSQSMLVADVGREMGIPVFCYFRGRDASYWLNNATRVKAYKKVFENLSGVFAVSQFLLDNLASKGISHPNSFAVPSGTDIDLFQPAKKDPNLMLACGRFVDKKAPQITIRSFLEAAKDFPDARLEMIGGGPEFKECQEIVAAAGAQNRVILHGQQDSQFVSDRLKHASVFVQHSVTDKKGEAEGLPSSIQEAMAAGCAILSTYHAGIAELVTPGETGYLAEEFDETEFTKLTKLMLSDPESCIKMGIASRKVAEDRIDYRKLYQIVETAITTAIDNQKK